jgi:hypothetical protein
LRGEFGQAGGGGLRAEQDQGLAAVGEEGVHGLLLAAAGGHRAQGDLVAGRFGRRVDALDQVGVEGALELELHAEQARAVAAQQPGPGVGPVADVLGGLQYPFAGGGARALGPAYDDRDQSRGHVGPCGHVGEGGPLPVRDLVGR